MKWVSQKSNCSIVISISLLETDYELINRFTSADSSGEVSKVRELLDAGVPVDIEGYARTALQWAAWKNSTDVTELLLIRGADVNKQSCPYYLTALHWAARYNSTDVIEVPLKHGASTNIKDGDGRTPIGDARGWNKETAVRLLEHH